jgi:anti-sigma factor RsiW
MNPADRIRGLKSKQRSMHPMNLSKTGKAPLVSCKQEVELIARYLSSNLQGRELAAYESHLAVCQDCVAFLKTYKTTIDLTRSFLASQAQTNGAPVLSLKPARKRRKRG